MSGIYIHIPFCKQACSYCDFHFSTSLNRKGLFVNALIKEIQLTKDYFEDPIIETVYLGGGTPSLLSIHEINAIFLALEGNYDLSNLKEVTLEANPDDLSLEQLKLLMNYTPISRLSIGVQSFFDEDLFLMNRSHGADEAIKCIENALKVGYENLTIDLIYGSPTTTHEMWTSNLQRALDFGIQHISAYCLTVEPKTALDYQIKKKIYPALDEDHEIVHFEILVDTLGQHGFDHYEISNFAKPGHYAIHNSNYWKGVPYLGLGPSAHSFDGQNRRWNIANNVKYIEGIQSGQLLYEEEMLSATERYNEYILTSFRTIWGCNSEVIAKKGDSFLTHFLKEVKKWIESEDVIEQFGLYTLSKKGKLIANRIASDLFWV